MANPIFRHYSVYIGGRKVAEASSNTYGVTDGGANQIGTEGVMGQSDGAKETKIEIDSIIPTAGTQIDFESIMLDNTRVVLGMAINGGFNSVECKLMSADYTSDSKTGECKGKFSFMGGAPQRVTL